MANVKDKGATLEQLDIFKRSFVDVKVTQENGKVLSTNDYDNTAKSKVDAIPENPKYTDTVYDDTEVRNLIGGKVDKVTGKGLSTNDYDNAAKTKVDAIPQNPKYTDTVYDDAELRGIVDEKADKTELHSHSNKTVLDGITQDNITQIGTNKSSIETLSTNKVDKVSGKGLSTNDYDATAKSKVDAIPENPKYTDTIYDDTEIRREISTAKEEIATTKEEVTGLKTYSDTFFRNFFALQRTGKKYTVRYPLWETSNVATGEKLDDNTGLVIEASTKTYRGTDDYANIPLFKTYDVNAKIENGNIKVTAVKGDVNFNDSEEDTFVLGMPYYEKTWCDEQYLYLSRSDSPLDGYTICTEAKKADGNKKEFCLYAKYQAGRNSANILGSYKGVKPQRNMSYNNNINEAGKRGTGYAFGMACDIQYLQNTYLIKYADKNFNNKLGGCFSFNGQYFVSVAEENVTRVILPNSQATFFPIGSSVSVGEMGEDTNKDRSNGKVHNICDNVMVIDIVDVDENNKALVLNVSTPFTTTATTLVTSMHWISGYSDGILGRDGCPCTDKSQITSLKYPTVLQGIEICVGGYEVLGNAFMDLVGDRVRDVYVCNDSSKLTTNVNTAKTTYDKVPKQMQFTTNNAWNYISEIHFDLDNGINIATQSGQSGTGSGTGYCDGFYVDGGTSGQREFLCFGDLGHGTPGGLFCVHGSDSLADAGWHVLARLSLNGFGGELAA